MKAIEILLISVGWAVTQLLQLEIGPTYARFPREVATPINRGLTREVRPVPPE